MLATIMQILDTTIANVALPSMQGSLNAAQDTITWVLTSYIVSAAIATPLTGWVSDRIGRKRLFLTAIAGFTCASMLCGTATSLEEMVVFRVAQGAFGAALVPLSQAVLLDINPRERHGQAMAIWGAGLMVGPIAGPTLGGWLTDSFNWRWAFYVNVPVGIVAFLGVLAFMPETKLAQRRFDLVGFAFLSLAVGALQMMLDRGQQLDWFSSTEILIEAGLVVAGFWMFAVHIATAKAPFIELAMVKDRNFVDRPHLHLHDRHHPARHDGAVAADAAEHPRLSGDNQRPCHGAARRRHDDLDDHGRAAGAEGRRAAPDSCRASVTAYSLWDMADIQPDDGLAADRHQRRRCRGSGSAFSSCRCRRSPSRR